ncbi:efflux RND transporter periplasmic adaptor subunit [Methylobacterium mesophilicum]|nr:HlyD family secretion protein [Methylobacterium mesophilicum]
MVREGDAFAPAENSEERLRPIRNARPFRIEPILMTLGTAFIAGLLGFGLWESYMLAPWTRDATVRAYVITQTPEVSGEIVNLPVHADRFVHKGDFLMEIDPTDYEVAVKGAEAAVAGAKADLEAKRAQMKRREQLATGGYVSTEEQQRFSSGALMAEAAVDQAQANLMRAKVNRRRTRLVSPVNGYITNLTVQAGDYASAGKRVLSIVNSDSFWIDAYFEETQLGRIHVGDHATAALMGREGLLKGHVESVARGIEVANAQAGAAGLASVNPVYSWIRLAQRVPVRIAIDEVPSNIDLVVGLTSTVQVEDGAKPLATVRGVLASWADMARERVQTLFRSPGTR